MVALLRHKKKKKNNFRGKRGLTGAYRQKADSLSSSNKKQIDDPQTLIGWREAALFVNRRAEFTPVFK